MYIVTDIIICGTPRPLHTDWGQTFFLDEILRKLTCGGVKIEVERKGNTYTFTEKGAFGNIIKYTVECI